MSPNRRLLAVAALAALLAFSLAAAKEPAAKPVTPEAALSRLKAGNQRFVDGKATHPRTDDVRRKETVKDGQHPFVTVLACADSRAPVERIFDQGIGDVFVIRVAGNVADTDEIGTIEYGVGHLHTPLVVVLGHSSCGAVTAVAEGAEVHGHIAELVDNIKPAVERARQEKPTAKGPELVAAAIEANVWQSVEDLLHRSDEVREKVAEKQVRVIGAIYDLESGVVAWLGEHPRQTALLGSKDTDAHADADHAPGMGTAVAGHTEARAQSHGDDSDGHQHATPTKDAAPKPNATPARPGPNATPDEVLAYLRLGNRTFAAGESTLPRLDATRRKETATGGQHPLVTVLSCSDSRVPVEALLNQGVGDVFIVRVAGNVADTDEIGSIEYGVEHLHTPVLLVLGHTSCGAVTAVATGAEVSENIAKLTRHIQPAVEAARAKAAGAKGEQLVRAATEANVWQSISTVFARSAHVRELVSAGKLKVIGAIYDLETGKVNWLGEHAEQARLLETGPRGSTEHTSGHP
ncbi:MAG: carbonic anhydrase [Phycisphaerales bacterium]|nr:carbonic anhydrase [Phycisphaerales bacterium]